MTQNMRQVALGKGLEKSGVVTVEKPKNLEEEVELIKEK